MGKWRVGEEKFSPIPYSLLPDQVKKLKRRGRKIHLPMKRANLSQSLWIKSEHWERARLERMPSLCATNTALKYIALPV